MKYMTKSGFTLTALTAAIGISAMPAQARDFKEGVDYHVVANPDTINGDHIIVREFFWYGCPHCYKLDPYMQEWSQNKDDDVIFLTSPAVMGPNWEANARGFYAAQLMGYQDETHVALFDAINKEGKRLFDQNSLANWYAEHGVDKNKFNSLYNSFAVETRLARSKAGALRYQLTGVPAVVVQGKYKANVAFEEMPELIEYLVDKVREEKQ